MSKSSARAALDSLLSNAERDVRALFAPASEPRLPLIEFMRCVDATMLPFLFGGSLSPEAAESATLYEFGFSTMLRTLFGDFSGSSGFPLMASSEQTIESIMGAWQCAGRIGFCRYLLELERLGLLTLEQTDANFRFRPGHQTFGVEAHDREASLWYAQAIIDQQSTDRAALNARRHEIDALLFDLVDNWRTHFIQYRAHPDLDEYFTQLGALHSQTLFGVDAFPGDARFGGIDFTEYRGALALLVGMGLKHAAFCRILLKKRPATRAHDVLTIFRTHEEVVESIVASTGADEAFALRLLEVTTLSEENLSHHSRVPGDVASPIFMVIGEDLLLLPVFGSVGNPYRFLLEELRRRFPSDWDRSVSARETAFRSELNYLFPPSRYVCSPSGIKVRQHGSVVTDIDAVIADKETGAVGLFQLKWQDAFARNMRSREVKKRNTLHTANVWVDRVQLWLSSLREDEICRRLGIGQIRGVTAAKVRLFVLGRHSVHFSGQASYSSLAAWGVWPQVLKLMEGGSLRHPLIASLHDALQATSPLGRAPPLIPLKRLEFRGAEVWYGNDPHQEDGA